MANKTQAEIKKLLWADADLSPEAIAAKLNEQDLHMSVATIKLYRTDFLNSVAVLRELGALKDAPTAKPEKKKASSPTTGAESNGGLPGSEEAE